MQNASLAVTGHFCHSFIVTKNKCHRDVHLRYVNWQVREVNFYKEGDVSPYRQTITNVTLERCWSQVLQQSDFERRKEGVEHFNRYMILFFGVPMQNGGAGLKLGDMREPEYLTMYPQKPNRIYKATHCRNILINGRSK